MIRTATVTAALCIVLCGGTLLTSAVTAAPLPLAAGVAFVKPVHGAFISQGFGCTDVSIEPADPACPGGHWHSGVDLAVPWGTPVYAAQSGVAHVYVSAYGFGLHVIIDHGGGLTSLYGHLSSIAVYEGEVVTAGALIGAVGSSGNSTGPHLHFEIDRDGIAEDPRDDVSLP